MTAEIPDLRPRRPLDTGFYAGLVLGGLLAAALLLPKEQTPEEPILLNESPAETAVPPAAVSAIEPQAAPPPKPARPAAAPRPAAPKGPRARLIASVRRNEGIFSRLGRRYTRRHEVIRRYGREWMSHPDLRKLNNDYFKDHDPVRFAYGAAASKNFVKLASEYASKPEMMSFVMDAARSMPRDLSQALAEYMNSDKTALELCRRFELSTGLPLTSLIRQPRRMP